MAKVLVRQVRDHFSSHQVIRVLELGCGTGRMTRQLAAAFPEAKITALDISSEMIRFAQTRYANINYVVADAEAFLRDARTTFDLIISNAAIQWFEYVDTTLTRACNLLAHKGILMVSTFGDQTFKELSQAFRHAYAEAGRPEVRHVVTMRTVHEWNRAFPEANVSQQFIVRSFPDVRQFLRSVQDAGAVNSMSGHYTLCRDVLREMSRHYTEHFSNLSIGHINATYHVVYIKCGSK
jgi:malonyl-CoA O-methyltransferase